MPLKSLLQAFKSRDKKPSGARLRVAVVGGGRMGQFHLKHLSRNPSVILTGIVDTSAQRREGLAKKFRTTALADPALLIGQIDAAIIASPTSTHQTVKSYGIWLRTTVGPRDKGGDEPGDLGGDYRR